MRVLGIDPGGADCALVVRDGHDLVAATHLLRVGHDRASWAAWCASHAARLCIEYQPDVVGVEDVAAPNPHVGRRRADGTDRGPRFIGVESLLDTAIAVGAILQGIGSTVDVVLVEPAGFGAPMPSRRHLLAAYPDQLVGPRERTGSGKSKWQHMRSAWDCAGATPRLVHTRAREARHA